LGVCDNFGAGNPFAVRFTSDQRLATGDHMQTMDELEHEYLPLRDKVRELREYL